MQLLYMTNIPSHHQFPVAQALHARLGNDFTLVFMEPVNRERAAMGWQDYGQGLPWVIRVWESAEAVARMRRCVQEYDAVVFGAVDTEIIRPRIGSGKLTFKYSERMWKKHLWRIVDPRINPRAVKGLSRDIWSIDRPNCHLLAASAYASWDFARIGAFQGRAWKWGYFPSVPLQELALREPPLRILWAGRMLRWKRVDLLIRAAARLRRMNLKFQIDLVGGGPERERLERLRDGLNLQNVIAFHPFTDPRNVRKTMKSSHIYVLPSDYNEGWGAVINEAMASGCCTVASAGAGAAPWLISHGETGYLFESGNARDLTRVLERCLADPKACTAVGRRARQSMCKAWSPEAAADRLICLCDGLLGKGPMPNYADGPCSSAPSVKRYSW